MVDADVPPPPAPDPPPGNAHLVEDELVRVDVVQEPLEAVALEPVDDGPPLGQVADVRLEQVVPVHVEEALVVVHPDLGHPGRVDPVGVVGDEVGVEGPGGVD